MVEEKGFWKLVAWSMFCLVVFETILFSLTLLKVEMMMIVIDEDYNDIDNPNVHEDLLGPVQDDVCHEKKA